MKAAEKRLREAIAADPVYAAAIDLMAARTARYEYGTEVVGAAQRLNREAPAASSPAALDLPELIKRVISTEASARADDLDERNDR